MKFFASDLSYQTATVSVGQENVLPREVVGRRTEEFVMSCAACRQEPPGGRLDLEILLLAACR